MQTVTFYSFKGGVGRTLAVANIARYLSGIRANVAVLDLDLEAPGLHYKLMSRDERAAVRRGVVDYLYDTCFTEGFDGSLATIAHAVHPWGKHGGRLDLLPAGTAPSASYWHRLSRLSWHDLFYASGGEGLGLFLELKERIATDLSPEYLLIDARTGITEVGGLATSVLADVLVCLFTSNDESLEGTRAALRGVRRMPRLPGQEPVRVIPVLARIPGGESEAEAVAHARAVLEEPAEELADTLSVGDILVLHSEPDLQLREELHVGSDKRPDQSALYRDYLALFFRIFPGHDDASRLDGLLDNIKATMLDQPERAQADLEALRSERPHPKAFGALLRFLRLRNAPPEEVFTEAHRAWRAFPTMASGDAPLLAQVIEACPELPAAGPDTADFVRAVLDGAGQSVRELSPRVARLLERQGRASEALETVHPFAMDGDGPALAELLRLLLAAGQVEEAFDVGRAHREVVFGHAEALLQWVRVLGSARHPPERLDDFIEEAKAALKPRRPGSPWSTVARQIPLLLRLRLLTTPRDQPVPGLKDTLARLVQRGITQQLVDVSQACVDFARYSDLRDATDKRDWKSAVRESEELLEQFTLLRAIAVLEHSRHPKR